MNNKEISIYIRGLVNISSYNLGYSYMESYCMKDLKDISKYFNISSKDIKLNKINKNIEPFFKEILNVDNKMIDTFTYLLQKKLGNYKNIYEPDDKTFKLIDSNNNTYPFYILDGIYFIEFEKMTVCFMIGNNE